MFPRTATDKSSSKVSKARNAADYLVKKFDKPDYRPFFLKAAWHLSMDTIMEIYERAGKKRDPLPYFISVCKLKIREDRRKTR